MNTKKWTTRDGTKIRIRDMEDGHLIRTIRMLHRVHDQELSEAYSLEAMVSSECAQDAAASVIAGMEDVRSNHPLYDDLTAEAERRGLTID